MAKGKSSRASKPGHVTKGNVFDDLGFSPAEAVEAKVKADLARDLVAYIKPLGLTQKELARQLNVHQPEVSYLLTGKLSKFSAGTLIQYAVKLNLNVQVKLTAAKTKRPAAQKPTAKPRRKEHVTRKLVTA